MDNRRVLFLDRDGGPPRTLPRQPDGAARVLAFGPRSDLLVTGGSGQSLRFWSLPDLRETRTVELGGLRTWWGLVRGDTLLLGTSNSGPTEGWGGVLQAVRLPDGELHVVGVNRPREWLGAIDPTGTQIAFTMGRTYGVRSLDATRQRVLGQMLEDQPQLFDIGFREIRPGRCDYASDRLPGANAARRWCNDGSSVSTISQTISRSTVK
jgi:hypothetical protein